MSHPSDAIPSERTACRRKLWARTMRNIPLVLLMFAIGCNTPSGVQHGGGASGGTGGGGAGGRWRRHGWNEQRVSRFHDAADQHSSPTVVHRSPRIETLLHSSSATSSVNEDRRSELATGRNGSRRCCTIHSRPMSSRDSSRSCRLRSSTAYCLAQQAHKAGQHA